MPESEGNGWSGYQRLVLSEIRGLKDEVHELRKELQDTRIDVAMLQVKSGVWGLVGGLLPFGLWVAYQLLSGNATP